MSDKQVVLNVGGEKFSTSQKTLGRKIPGEDFSFFNSLDCTGGEVFIDRDSTVFKYILNYLRNGRIVFPNDALTKVLLSLEAKFYGLVGLHNVLERGLHNFETRPSDYARIVDLKIDGGKVCRNDPIYR
uniref:BTB domain-containing protein n=1 Tax=Haemonchus contortus TaxID=6289 RepID=A0A7I4Y083_HAECO